MAQYFHLFHGERFSDLQTFMSLYPSRFREPMDLPSPEGKDVKNILFYLIFFKIVDLIIISFDIILNKTHKNYEFKQGCAFACDIRKTRIFCENFAQKFSLFIRF